jgi:hypothetical protein
MAATVSACMTATPYQPYEPELTAGIHGGYSEQNLSSGRYLVRFHGNQLTARDRVEGYLLYRAAELTIQNGSNWFLIVDRHTEHDVETYIRPDPLYQPWYGSAYGYWRPHWRYYRKGYGWDVWHPEADPSYWADRPAVTRIESFEAEAEIVLGQGQRPENEPRAFEARQVIANLGPTLERPRGQE